MSLDRYLLPLIFAAGVTFLLFWCMTLLIRTTDSARVEPVGQIVSWVIVRTDTPIETKTPPKIVRPEPFEAPKTEPFPPITDSKSIGLPIDIGPMMKESRTGRRGPALVEANSDAIPLVRVPPQYPATALQRGIEGRVLIEFNVGRNGAVNNPRIIASEPERVFDKAAIKAVEQWRYEPKIENGKPKVQQGLRIVIPFQLGGESG